MLFRVIRVGYVLSKHVMYEHLDYQLTRMYTVITI
jgi:hypothetical protein